MPTDALLVRGSSQQYVGSGMWDQLDTARPMDSTDALTPMTSQQALSDLTVKEVVLSGLWGFSRL